MFSATQTDGDNNMLLLIDPEILILIIFGWGELYECPLHCAHIVLTGSAWVTSYRQNKNIFPRMYFVVPTQFP